MRFSTRTLYGLKALFFLASRYGQGSVAASQIAKKENVPTAYLEQILNTLKKRGFVRTIRGPQGGYTLSKKPADMDLKEVFYALTPKAFAEFDGAANSNERLSDSQIAERLFWLQFRSSIHQHLSAKSLQDWLDESHKLKNKNELRKIHFHI